MENLVPPVAPLQTNEPKSNGQENTSTQLYNPNNWVFYSFFLSPIVPAIFYYRNFKILGKPEEGKKILLAAIASILILIVAGMFLNFGKGPGFILSIAWIFFFFQKKEKNKPLSIKKRKEKFPNSPRPKEWPVVVTVLLVVAILVFFMLFADTMSQDIYSASPYRKY